MARAIITITTTKTITMANLMSAKRKPNMMIICLSSAMARRMKVRTAPPRANAYRNAIRPQMSALNLLKARRTNLTLTHVRRKLAGAESRRRRGPVRYHRRRRTAGIEGAHFLAAAAPLQIIEENVCAERNQRHGQHLAHRKLYRQQRVRQEQQSQRHENHSPRERIAVQLARDRVFFGIRRQTGAHQLRRAASIDSREQPGAKNAENEEGHAVGNHGHLEKAGKDCEMDQSLGCLSVVSRAQSRDETR